MIAKRRSTSRGAATIAAKAKRCRRVRRELGIFYTPAELVEPILDAVLSPVMKDMVDEPSCQVRLETLRIIDPACGSGHFLIGAWRRLARRIVEVVGPANQHDALQAAARCLHGIDIDPQAADAGLELLRVECKRWGMVTEDFCNWITIGDALLGEHTGDGAFDLVIGNPPFVDSEAMCASDRAKRLALSRHYTTARGNWDLASIFVERAIQLVRLGGRIGFVLPRRLLASDHAQHVQQLIGRQTIESILVNDADAFEGATVETISLMLRIEPPREGHVIRIVNSDCSHSFVQNDLDCLPPGHWSAILAPPTSHAPRLKPLFVGRPRLGDCAFVGDGATTAEAYRLREVIVEAEEARGDAVRLINTGTIDPFEQRWGRRPTRYLKSAWMRPVVPLAWLDAHLPRRAVQARSSKVLVAGLAGRIEAVVDDGAALCGKSAVQVIPGEGIDLHALCAWLNSTPINDLYRRLFESHGFGARSMHIGPRQLEQLPLWRLKALKHNEAVVELARLSVELHRLDATDHEWRALNLSRIDEIVMSMLE